MAAYKDLVGQKITKVTSNPGEPKTGQMWYNSTSGALRGLGVLEAFSSSAPMGTGRYNCAGWAGSAPADTSICYGGMTAAPAISNLTEEFNGSGWAAGGNTNTSRRQGAGFGIQTAAVKTGGYDGSSPSNENDSEEYNGTSWTAGNNINPQRQGHAGAGTLTAGVIFGGYDGTIINKTEEYDGTNFSNVNNMNTARTNVSGVGSQTTSLAFGGGTPSASNATETYDGTNWTTVANMNTARQGMGSFGDSSTATGTGGTTGSNSTATETWDGTSWSTSPATLATARAFYGDCGCGSSTNGIVAGGSSTATVAITEEYNKSTNTITAAAWGTGGAMNTGRSLMGSFGTRTAAVGVAGLKNPYATYSNDTEKYDGTSWTASGNYPQSIYSVGSAGTSTAGLAFGGHLPGPSSSNTTCEFDGSTWTAQGSPGNVPVSGGYSNGFGTQTAAIANLPGASTTIAYDGSSWTAYGSPGNMNTGRLDGYGQNGTSTAGLVVAGRTAPGPTNTTNTEEWNGSTWSASGAYPTAMVFVQSNGTQTAAAGAGGDKMPGEAAQTTTCTYDGSTWATAPNLGTAVSRHGGANGAPSTQGTIYSGNIPGITTTQEFTGETTATNITDFTTS